MKVKKGRGLMAALLLLGLCAPSVSAGERDDPRERAEQTILAAEDALSEARRDVLRTRDAARQDARRRVDRISDALLRAENRFGSGNYEGATEHAEKAIAILADSQDESQ